MGQFYLDQDSFAGRCDNGNETAATWKYADGSCGDTVGNATNRNFSQMLDENFRIRFLVQEYGGKAGSDIDFQLQYSLNGSDWYDVTSSSSYVRAFSSGYYSDGDDTTQQVGSGSNYVTNNDCMDSGDGACGGTNCDIGAGYEVECEFCIQLRSADLSATDTVQLRLTAEGDELDSYTHTPTVTALSSTSPISGTCAVAFGGSGTITGRGVISGQADATFGGSGTIVGRGVISGQCDVVFGGVGDLGVVPSLISGTCDVVFGGTGAVFGRGVISGQADVVFGGSGSIVGKGVISGTCAVAFGGTGTLTDALAGDFIDGTCAVVFGGSGVLIGRGVISGSCSVAFAGSGSLTGRGVISGAAPVQFGGDGSLVGRGQISGTAMAIFGGSGALVGRGVIAGTSLVTFGGSGTMTGRGVLVGNCAVVFGGVGNLTDALASNAISGTCPVVFGGVGRLTNKRKRVHIFAGHG